MACEPCVRATSGALSQQRHRTVVVPVSCLRLALVVRTGYSSRVCQAQMAPRCVALVADTTTVSAPRAPCDPSIWIPATPEQHPILTTWGSSGPPRTQPDWRRAPPQTTEVGVVIAIGPIEQDIADLRAPNPGRTIPRRPSKRTLFSSPAVSLIGNITYPPLTVGEPTVKNWCCWTTTRRHASTRAMMRIPPGNFGPGPVASRRWL